MIDIRIVVVDKASAAFGALVEALDRIAGWTVDAIEIDRWADDGGRAP